MPRGANPCAAEIRPLASEKTSGTGAAPHPHRVSARVPISSSPAVARPSADVAGLRGPVPACAPGPGRGRGRANTLGTGPSLQGLGCRPPPPPTEYQLLKPRVGRWPCSCLRPQASLRGGGSLSLSQLALLCSDPHPPRAHTARGHQLTARLRLGQGASVCQWPRAVPRSPNTLRGWGGACARLAGHLCDSPSDGAAEAADTHYPIVGRLRRPQSCSS